MISTLTLSLCRYAQDIFSQGYANTYPICNFITVVFLIATHVIHSLIIAKHICDSFIYLSLVELSCLDT